MWEMEDEGLCGLMHECPLSICGSGPGSQHVGAQTRHLSPAARPLQARG